MAADTKLIRQFLVSGTVTSAPIPDELFATAMESAAAPEVMTDGKPTIMLVEAWMLHEGKNLNGDVFRLQDLEMIAAQVAAPNFLPMDWNHSTRWGEGLVVGVWYGAEKAFNPKADDGAGKWGVKAHGMLWAWAYPDKAQSLLADMERDGAAAFSMMCIAKDMIFGRGVDGYYTVLVEPTMFALSALSVSPGDVDASGVGVEGGAGEDLSKKLDERVRRWQAAAVELFAPFAVATLTHETQGAMMEHKELEAQLAAMKTANEQLETEKEAAEAAAAQAETEKAEAEKALAELEAEVAKAADAEAAAPPEATQTASAEELQVALEALKSSYAELEAALAAEQVKVTELTEKLSAIEATAAEEALTAMKEARYDSLPGGYRQALEKRGDAVVLAFKERWATASTEQWEAFREDIAIANPSLRISYQELSDAEGGVLPQEGQGNESIADILARTK